MYINTLTKTTITIRFFYSSTAYYYKCSFKIITKVLHKSYICRMFAT